MTLYILCVYIVGFGVGAVSFLFIGCRPPLALHPGQDVTEDS
jgi:hypothetical protein